MNGANNKVLADMIDSPLGLSPMGNLTINFNESSLSSTPCYKINGRRLSMSSLTPNTPTSNNSLFDTSDGEYFIFFFLYINFLIRKKTLNYFI